MAVNNVFGKSPANEVDATIEVDMQAVLVEDFLGAGVQWSAYPWFDVSESDWQKVFKRVDYLKLPFARVMVDMTTFFAGLDENGQPRYLFDCELMQRVYKLLDYCQRNNVIVMAGQWGWSNTAKHRAAENWDFAPDSAMHARISADYINHLVNVKGYSCIRWYDVINEPDGGWSSCNGNWELWARVAKNLGNELSRRGLTNKVRLSGPCDCFRGWINKAVQDRDLREVIDIYNEHKYMWNKDVVSGRAGEIVKERIDKIKQNDPGKGYFAGEVGFLDGKNKQDQQLSVYEFWYGVSMADAAIQLIRAGAWGFLAWDMDDSMHWAGDSDGPLEAPPNAYERRKIWGFWNITGAEHGMAEDENIRPWFYTWSAISRNFPPGCQTLKVGPSGAEAVRAAAARIPQADKYHLSFAVVNNSDRKTNVKIVVPKANDKVTLSSYEYFDTNGDNKVDSWSDVVDKNGNDIFPSANSMLRDVDLAGGVTVSLPPKAVVVLTTLEGGSAIPMKP